MYLLLVSHFFFKLNANTGPRRGLSVIFPPSPSRSSAPTMTTNQEREGNKRESRAPNRKVDVVRAVSASSLFSRLSVLLSAITAACLVVLALGKMLMLMLILILRPPSVVEHTTRETHTAYSANIGINIPCITWRISLKEALRFNVICCPFSHREKDDSIVYLCMPSFSMFVCRKC